MTEAAPDISITRVFDAPRELVYAAWTDPKQFAAWFGGTEAEVPPETATMDLRVGGEWKLTMLVGPDRSEMPWHGEFLELDPPARLVMTIADSTAGELRDTCTVILAEVGTGKTEMLFEQRGGHMSVEQYEAARQGWMVFFDTLADLLPAG